MNSDPLTADLMMSLFDELSDHLASYAEHGRLFLVGGAAMALVYDIGRATQDIDALFQPRHAITEAVRVIGERHHLPPDWLNDSAGSFVTADDLDPRIVYQTEHLTVSAASPQFLLAMKVRSARLTKDAHDASVLAAILGLDTADSILTLAQQYLPTETFGVRERRFAQAVATVERL